MISSIADKAKSKTHSKIHTQLPLPCSLFIVRISQALNLYLRILGIGKWVYIFTPSKLLTWGVGERELNWKSGQDLNIYVRISGTEKCVYLFYSLKFLTWDVTEREPNWKSDYSVGFSPH